MIPRISKKDHEARLAQIRRSYQEANAPKITIDEVVEMMPPLVAKAFKEMPGLYGVMEHGDFTSHCVLKFMTNGFLTKYDGRIQKHVYLWVAMKRAAIDILRQSSSRREKAPMISESQKSNSDEEFSVSLYDLMPVNEDPLGEIILLEAMEDLDKSGPFDRTYDFEDLKEITFSEYWVFYLTEKGYDKQKLSEFFGVTTTTVGNYIKRAQKKLQENWEPCFA